MSPENTRTIPGKEGRKPVYPESAIDQIAAEWAEMAEPLADWVLSRLVVRRDVYGSYKADGGQFTAHEALDRDHLIGHFLGRRIVGLHSTSADGKCKSVAADIDAHDDGADPKANLRFAVEIVNSAHALGLAAYIFDSNGKGGYHVRAFFDKLIPSEVAHWLVQRLVANHADFGFDKPPEVFPKQPTVTMDRPFGNWLRIFGRHHKRAEHWSRVAKPKWDGEGRIERLDERDWIEGRAAVQHLLKIKGSKTPRVVELYNQEMKARAEAGNGKPADPIWNVSAGRNGRSYDKPNAETIREALGHLPDDLADGYDPWLATGMSLHDWDPSAGLPLWLDFSRRSGKFDEAVCRAKWETFTAGAGLTIGFIFKGAKDRGWVPPWDRKVKIGGRTSSNGDGEPPTDGPTIEAADHFPRTEIGLAERLVHQYGHKVRFCHPWNKWLAWDGRRWKEDDKGRARLIAKTTIRALYAEAAMIPDQEEREDFIKWALGCEKKKTLDAMLGLATFHEGIPVVPDEMDRDPWLLNASNGTIDLRTGGLRPHRKGDLLTKLCPVEYDPAAECPLWLETIRLFLGGDGALIGYWQRLCGYAITGVIRDHILPIAYGTGSNGKSTILGTLLEVLGPDYAMKAPADLLMAKEGTTHPTERASLFGKRLVLGIETEDGRRFNESLVKELTGGDTITARRMREDFWSFSPSHKIILATNHKPSVRGTDHGIWRRLKLIPFTVAMPDSRADKAMPDRLKAEAPGILAWCVRGCLEWQRDGLGEPSAVSAATSGYRQDEDVLGTFIASCCVIEPEASIQSGELYAAYKAWSESSGQGALSLVRFGKSIEERGIAKDRKRTVTYQGIRLLRPGEKPREEEQWKV